jgi:hypothetical protein
MPQAVHLLCGPEAAAGSAGYHRLSSASRVSSFDRIAVTWSLVFE